MEKIQKQKNLISYFDKFEPKYSSFGKDFLEIKIFMIIFEFLSIK